jgi:tetratricopeptide (TPR) repeat protein
VNSAPIAADVHARTAVVSEAAADHAGSIAEYRKALRLEPYEDVYYRALARDLIELAVGAPTTGASERAPRDAAEAVAMPARRLARLSRDQLLGTAAILLRRARSLEPSNPNIDTGLARLYSVWAKDADGARRVGLLERSSAWYRRAVKLAPHAVALRLELGVNQIAGLEYSAAIATLTSAIALEPAREVTVARELRGDARLGIGEVDSALADYRRALHDNPDALFDDNLASRVRVVGREGRLDTLIETFRAAIRNEPPEKRWLTEKTLGFLYAQIGARDLARHEFAAARATAPAALRPRIDELLHRLRRPS